MAKLFFSRYSLVSGKSTVNKFELLLMGLANKAAITKRGFVYQFFDATPFMHRGEEFIFGYLVKYNPDDVEEVVTDDSKLGFERLPNKVNGKARFILFPKGSVLMHCEVPRAISQQTSQTFFANSSN